MTTPGWEHSCNSAQMQMISGYWVSLVGVGRISFIHGFCTGGNELLGIQSSTIELKFTPY